MGSTGDQINIFHKLEIPFIFKGKKKFQSRGSLDIMTEIEFMLLIAKKKKKSAKWPVGLLEVLGTECMGSGMIWILSVPPKGRSSFIEGKAKEGCLLLAKL